MNCAFCTAKGARHEDPFGAGPLCDECFKAALRQTVFSELDAYEIKILDKRVEQWHIENRKPFRNKDLIWEAAELACHDEIEWEDLAML